MSPGEILAKKRGQVGEVLPQHILFHVTLGILIINPGAHTAATTALRPSLYDIQATLPLHSSVGERSLVRHFNQMRWPGVPLTPVCLLG